MDYSKNTTIKIKGGLGNQLFQYSFAIFLEQNFNKKVTLDLSWFDQQSLRSFQLPEFLNEPILTTKIFKKNFCQKVLSYRSENIISFLLKKKINLPLNYFDGYWQDIFYAKYLLFDKYFKKHLFLKKIIQDYYVIHLRRGDFLTSGSNVQYALSDDHYLKYVNLFDDKPIYILSTEKEEAIKLSKKINSKSEYVDCNDIEAFNIIYNSSGGIASNSTFCWWPIFLSECRNWFFPYKFLKKKNILELNLAIDDTILI